MTMRAFVDSGAMFKVKSISTLSELFEERPLTLEKLIRQSKRGAVTRFSIRYTDAGFDFERAIVEGAYHTLQITQGAFDYVAEGKFFSSQFGRLGCRSYRSVDFAATAFDFDTGKETVDHMTNATEKQIASAFTEWERRYREDPEAFQSEGAKLLKETPKTYGDACAPYFLQILGEVQSGKRRGKKFGKRNSPAAKRRRA